MEQIENRISSREVAEMMGREHKNVLKKIDGLNKDLTSLTLSPLKYWCEGSYFDYKGEKRREYQVTELGCELIAHKTIGKDGTAFTVKYMDRFHKMRDIIQQNNKPQLPNDYLSALKALVASEEEKIKLKAENEKKGKFINQISISDNSLLVREVAKIASKNNIKIGEKRLWDKLRDWGMIFKNSTEPKQMFIDRGYFEVVEGVRTTRDKTFTYHTTRVTGKGQTYIINRLLKEA